MYILVSCVYYRFVINLGTPDREDISKVACDDTIQGMEIGEPVVAADSGMV